MLRVTLLLPAVVLIGAAGCASSQSVVQAEDGVPFVLALGDVADLDGHTIRFEEVVEDSRCPEGAECVWAGRASIAVSVDGEAVTLEVPSQAAGSEPQMAGRVEVEAMALRPYPTLDPGDAPVRATLVATLAD